MIEQATYVTKLGNLKISYEKEKSSWFIEFQLTREYDEGSRNKFTFGVANQIKEYLVGKRKKFDFDYEFKNATLFQIRVWRALMEIPYGETKTYKEIAIQVGRPNSIRPIISICENNPLIIYVPSHRLTKENGDISSFKYGDQMKKDLLILESNNK